MSTCGWPVDRTCLPDLPADNEPGYAAALAQRNANEDIAVSVLWALSGRQFGCTRKIVRPEPPGSRGICDDAPLIEAYYRNDFRGVPVGRPTPRAVKLAGPVAAVHQVVIGADVLDPSEYTVEDDTLYRRGASWPYNNLGLPRGEAGTWWVEYDQGLPAPAHVARFVGQLAAEMITACEGGKCRLPRTVVSTSRSGVTHVFDPTRMLAAGFTGIPDVDTWLASVNPNKLAHQAVVR